MQSRRIGRHCVKGPGGGFGGWRLPLDTRRPDPGRGGAAILQTHRRDPWKRTARKNTTPTDPSGLHLGAEVETRTGCGVRGTWNRSRVKDGLRLGTEVESRTGSEPLAVASRVQPALQPSNQAKTGSVHVCSTAKWRRKTGSVNVCSLLYNLATKQRPNGDGLRRATHGGEKPAACTSNVCNHAAAGASQDCDGP